jgi:hypothetical protein
MLLVFTADFSAITHYHIVHKIFSYTLHPHKHSQIHTRDCAATISLIACNWLRELTPRTPFLVWVWVLCYDRRSAGQSVLEQSTHLWLTTRSLLLSDSCGFVDLELPVWREDGSVLYNCCWSSPAQSFSGPSPVGLVAIFYCLRFETSFSSPLTTRRVMVEVFDPASTRVSLLRNSSFSYKLTIGLAENASRFTVAWRHSLAWKSVYRALRSNRCGCMWRHLQKRIGHVTPTHCCTMQAFTELSLSNAPTCHNIMQELLVAINIRQWELAQWLLLRASEYHHTWYWTGKLCLRYSCLWDYLSGIRLREGWLNELLSGIGGQECCWENKECLCWMHVKVI